MKFLDRLKQLGTAVAPVLATGAVGQEGAVVGAILTTVLNQHPDKAGTILETLQSHPGLVEILHEIDTLLDKAIALLSNPQQSAPTTNTNPQAPAQAS